MLSDAVFLTDQIYSEYVYYWNVCSFEAAAF